MRNGAGQAATTPPPFPTSGPVPVATDRPFAELPTELRVDGTTLVVDLAGVAVDDLPAARLTGPRATVPAEVAASATGVTLRFPLLVTRWGVPGLALPAGGYAVELDGDATPVPARPGPVAVHHQLFRAEARVTAGVVTVRVAPPFADHEQRPRPHRDHRQVFLRGRTSPQNAVYFESFYGRSASDNPAAIDRALAALRPDVTRYWSVTDGSVAVPEGAVRLVEGTDEWWRVRAEARVYVINDWLRWTFHRRPYQHVLQTWHGTPLKRLALDRRAVSLRTRSAVIRQQARWDALLSQNSFCTTALQSAYRVRCPVWELGYPRNDVLAEPDRAPAIRAAVGVPAGARVVLYAPTWRDDQDAMVDHLDTAAFAAALPPDHVLLVRGHSRTLAHGADHSGGRLIDVTSYPDMAHLMLLADVLVTDYSSSMFDFARTGRPIVFYAPDSDHFAERLRGFYFDIYEHAPGPVVTTADEVLDAVRGLDTVAAQYREPYAAWRERFTPTDDGRAGERVVQRMLDEGWLLPG